MSAADEVSSGAFAGPYELLATLGKGGMGTVFRARHRDSGATVAVKTVTAPSELLLACVRREVRGLARLTHPGIVRIVDEDLGGPHPWYAMELIDGVTLGRYVQAPGAWRTRSRGSPSSWWTESLGAGISTKPGGLAAPVAENPGTLDAELELPWRKDPSGEVLRGLLTIARRLCSPLAYLHGEGFVHGDLKPENVLVRGDGAPLLVDFGLALQVGGRVSRDVLHTGAISAGTPAYMAPERIRGDVVDARSDLYSLGCLLYELVAGRPPFTAPSVGELARAHLTRPPAPLDALFPGELPPGLSELVDRLLAKSPRERLGYADDVARMLAATGAGNGGYPGAPAPHPYLYRPFLAGRETIMQRLQSFLAEAVQESGGILLLGGESGLGKTRCLLELAEQAGRQLGMCVLAAECRAVVAVANADRRGSGTPLAALRPVLVAIGDHCREWGKRECDRVLGARGPLLAAFAPPLASLPGQQAYAPPPEVPPERARERLFTALLQTLKALAGDAAVLILIDDLQWADELTLAFVVWLAANRTLAEDPVCVLGAYRTEESESLARLLAARGVERVELARLGPGDIAEMAGDMLGRHSIPKRLAALLDRLSEGNPFFVAEYLRGALYEGLLARDATGRWVVADDAGPGAAPSAFERLALPENLRELVERRLDRLSAAARSAAELAAVLGRTVALTVLAAAAGARELLAAAIDELRAALIIDEPAPNRLRFTHDKFREVAYERLSPERRQALHGSAARALERCFAADLDEQLGALGAHWEAAGDAAAAAAYFRRDGERAMQRFAYQHAEQAFRRYLQAASAGQAATARTATESDPGDATAITVHRALGEALFLQGRYRESLAALRGAEQVAERRGIGQMPREIVRATARSYWRLGETERARELFRSLIPEEGGGGDDAIVAEALLGLGGISLELGSFHEAWSYFERAESAFAALGLELRRAGALTNKGIVLHKLARYDASNHSLLAALRVIREVGDPYYESRALTNLGANHYALGNIAAAREAYDEAARIARDSSDLRALLLATGNLGTMSVLQGDIEVSEGCYNQAIELAHTLSDDFTLAYVLCGKAGVLRLALNDLPGAASLLDDADRVTQRTGDLLALRLIACERGHLSLASGADATAHLLRATEIEKRATKGTEHAESLVLSRLRRACEAHALGHPLIGGQCREDVSPELRSRLLRQE
ncbi:MAG: protein kinase [Candidatus Schekmanbacteria bacterium]|nr:protein kinase [Candidatus Schekmanbacteria bacterium]